MTDRLLTQLQAYQEESKDARDATIRLGRFSFPLRFFTPLHLDSKRSNSVISAAVIANAMGDNWWPEHTLGYMMQTTAPLSVLANINVPFTTMHWVWGNKLVLWDSSKLPWADMAHDQDAMLPLCPVLGSPSRDARKRNAVEEVVWHLMLHDLHTGGEVGELMFVNPKMGMREVVSALFREPNVRMAKEAWASIRDTSRYEWGNGRVRPICDLSESPRLLPVLNRWAHMASRVGPAASEQSFALLAVTDTWNAQQTTRML